MAPPVAPQNGGDAEGEEPKAQEPVLREMQLGGVRKLTEEQQAELQKASEEISQKTLEKLRLIREKEKRPQGQDTRA